MFFGSVSGVGVPGMVPNVIPSQYVAYISDQDKTGDDSRTPPVKLSFFLCPLFVV